MTMVLANAPFSAARHHRPAVLREQLACLHIVRSFIERSEAAGDGWN
jgi:hypothetical protein